MTRFVNQTFTEPVADSKVVDQATWEANFGVKTQLVCAWCPCVKFALIKGVWICTSCGASATTRE